MLRDRKTEEAMQNTLVVFDANGNWMVAWTHTPEAATIARLFDGTTVLPTPYTTLIPVSEVITALRMRNPKYKAAAAANNGITHYLPEKHSNRAGDFVPAPKVS